MKDRRTKIKEAAHLMMFLVFFVLTVVVNLNCSSEDDNPAASPECGSGRVTWNDKAQRCIDLADGGVVPDKCCGR
jgi:hypothetical protein